jgi:hypothetical protein
MFYLAVALTVLLGLLGARPLLAGAAYRFRGKTMLAVEGFGLWACAVVGILTMNVWLLAGAAIVGVGITQLPNAQKRLE